MWSAPALAPERVRRVESPPAASWHTASVVASSAAPFLLLALGIGLRIPDLLTVPGFTDETIDVRIALNMLHGQWPLVDGEPYIGSLFNALIAAAFVFLGPEAYVPRLVVAVLGGLTVVVTYFLGRRLGGQLCGVLAAGFMATSAPQIFLSHIAWSNCITPLFATATLLAVAEASARKSSRLLMVAGCLYGLTLQTHVSAVFLVPALVVQLWTAKRNDRAWLRSWWSCAAAVCMVVAYANVIAFNVLDTGAWEVAARQKEYAYVAQPTLEVYGSNLIRLGAAVVRMLGAALDGSTLQALAQPSTVMYLSLIAGGAIVAFGRRLYMPLLAIAGTALMMPYVNMNYDVPFGVRYIGFLLPPLYVLMSLALCWLFQRLQSRGRMYVVASFAAMFVLVAFPAAQFSRFAEGYKERSLTSPTILALDSAVRSRYAAGLIGGVLLDTQLDWVYTAPGGRALRSFALLFDMQGVPERTVWMQPDELRRTTADAPSDLILIISAASRERLGADFPLVRLDLPDDPFVQRDGYWAYLLPSPAQAKRPELNADSTTG